MKNRQFLVIAALIVLTVAACGGETQTPAPAEAGVVIAAVNETKQYIELRNDGQAAQSLAGWSLSLGRQATCRLSDALSLAPGETLRIWVLAHDASQGGYNCGLDQPFWSGKEPKRIFLYNAGDELVDKYFAGKE